MMKSKCTALWIKTTRCKTETNIKTKIRNIGLGVTVLYRRWQAWGAKSICGAEHRSSHRAN